MKLLYHALISVALACCAACLLSGCEDDVTVSKAPGLEGTYQGTYSYLSITNETDTTANISYKVKVTFDRPDFFMVPSELGSLSTLCGIVGEYVQSADSLFVSNLTDSSYARGVCDVSFGAGGNFQYRLVSGSLKMVSEVTVGPTEGQLTRTIKQLSLKRQR